MKLNQKKSSFFALSIVSLLFLFLAGCSSTPNYVKGSTTRSSPLSMTIPEDSEKAIFSPSNSTAESDRFSGAVGFEYDLSVLPPNIKIINAYFEVYALEKKVLARSLGECEAKHLAPPLIPTSFIGSQTTASDKEIVPAYDSTVQWKSGGLESILARTGGTGGRGVYITSQPGWDRYNITKLVSNAMITKKKIISVRLGFRPGSFSLSDFTIFGGAKAIPQILVYAGTTAKDNAPRVVVVYKE